ncbi:precorrin-6A synthase (deacetylating) [soil metagenome]
MRQIYVIGIGAGNPEYITIQAINALNAADVFFLIDKGAEKGDLAQLRKEICERYIKDKSYRMVEARDPPRDRKADAYESAVVDWHEKRADIFERMISEELGEDECGAFLVWGDPALYDGTIRILEMIAARGKTAFSYDVIPGISSVQALTARHKIPLNRIGEPIHITTGRQVAGGLPETFDNVVVMLDGQCAFNTIHDPGVRIYWGAYLGTEDELLIAGKLDDVADTIEKTRAEARERKGWIMDTYLLRRTRN